MLTRKIISTFEKEYNNPEIVTFADLRWSEGNLYYKNGFKLEQQLPPDYSWVKGGMIWHKFNWRRDKIKRLLPYYNKQLTTDENMYLHGFSKIWDCGKLKFSKK